MDVRQMIAPGALMLVLSLAGCRELAPEDTARQQQQQLQKDLDGVYRAGKAIEGALQVGVNPQQFGELLIKMSSEIEIVRDKVRYEPFDKASEAATIDAFAEALQTYKDAYQVWGTYVQAKSNGCYPVIQGNLNDKSACWSVREILGTFENIKKYKPNEPFLRDYSPSKRGGYVFGMRDVQFIWGVGGERLATANGLFFGTSSPKPPSAH
jgi:hypothetical protein